ncbi:MAG: hypothetical protein COU46_01270 [Candidatus Niyogibacteria bacterium CG10_big_fil_rev_8_21_14_0_10_42_19]|uniref:Fibronectin type-III domain-containing protein n=1 Tax=Candidatus Niyogibacteria bacterium CG10_big_fil_rev_8_21_14_0_10_42_19 TaxID=1974725 RepID=A0A2H0TG06_9BACT|nr:MAG: hypothetical protein COU46_01270 [Candidatus Niyogibacteria bacterium CG10_big_fil_rev_8_21_14_0_10_42_19]
MLDFIKTIKRIKKLRKIEPDKLWLGNRRLYFVKLANVDEKNSYNRTSLFRNNFAGVVTAVLVIFVITGGLVLNSAQAALPEDILYSIKLLSERLGSFVIIGDENKINYALTLAERRLDEAEQIGESNHDEVIISGVIKRAENNLIDAENFLVKANNQGKGKSKDFKKLNKALNNLEKLLERRNSMSQKFASRLPGIVEALDSFDDVSVEVVRETGKFVLTFNFSDLTSTSSTSTLSSDDQDDDEDEDGDGSEKKTNRGLLRVVELLENGAGKSGKVPPGLTRAPGIQKKIQALIDHDNDDDGDNDDEDGDDEQDEDENNDADNIAPAILSITVTNATTTSATINWTTDEPATSKVYYLTTTPLSLPLVRSTIALVTSHSVDLTDLTASSTYYFILESADASGNTATSSESSFNTSD